MRTIAWTPITDTEFIPPLGPALAAHIQSYRNTAVRQASCSVWGLLYRELSRLGAAPAEVAFTAGGKPCFPDCHIRFSLSHSKGLCAVSLADVPTGVDIQLIKDCYNPRLVKRSLSIAERESYDGDFTRLWCRKEAYAKLTGTGLTGYPCYIDTTALSCEFTEEKISWQGNAFWLVSAFGG